MLLSYALRHAECPICLQPLAFDASASGRSRSVSCGVDAVQGSSSSLGSGTGAAPGTVIEKLTSSSSLVHSGGGDGFSITFAPGISRKRGGEHWHDMLSSAMPSLSHCSQGGGESCSGQQQQQQQLVVLSCGHLLHQLCAMQLYDYSAKSSCPVCRAPIRSMEDLVLFEPQTRPIKLPSSPLPSGDTRASYVPGPAEPRLIAEKPSVAASCDGHTTLKKRRGEHALEAATNPTLTPSDAPSAVSVKAESPSPFSFISVPATNNNNNDSATAIHVNDQQPVELLLGEISQSPLLDNKASGSVSDTTKLTSSLSDSSLDSEDILIVSTRQVPPAQVYRDHLQRIAKSVKSRTSTLAGREQHLQGSLAQLNEDCVDLASTVESGRRRLELMSRASRGFNGKNGVAATEVVVEELQRVADMRQLCLETRHSCDCVTRELAAAIREGEEVKRQLEKYNRKMSRRE